MSIFHRTSQKNKMLAIATGAGNCADILRRSCKACLYHGKLDDSTTSVAKIPIYSKREFPRIFCIATNRKQGIYLSRIIV